jgi:copper homeostasis protein
MANDDEQPAWEVEEPTDSPPAPAVILEACCDSRESVRNAVEGGALRVEICARSSLHVGGLTPSPALVRAALAEAADVVALVRVRSGDFVYTEEELRDMVAEVQALRSVGCRGFALGCLGADGSIDEAATATLIDAAGKDAVICFHRASDEVLRRAKDLRAVDRVASALERLGCARVLSSGGAATARGGRSTLWALQKACGRRRIAVVVAGGVSEANAGLLVRDTGCTQLHAATALTHEVARAAPTSLFFATEKVVSADRVASLNAALAAAAALNEAQATTARVVGDASAPVERWWWQGIF